MFGIVVSGDIGVGMDVDGLLHEYTISGYTSILHQYIVFGYTSILSLVTPVYYLWLCQL